MFPKGRLFHLQGSQLLVKLLQPFPVPECVRRCEVNQYLHRVFFAIGLHYDTRALLEEVGFVCVKIRQIVRYKLLGSARTH